MSPSDLFLNPAEAAVQLGVSAKALRVYEQRGLLLPLRTAAGWRTYGPQQMARGREIVALRGLGLSLAQVKRVLWGDGSCLEAALATRQSALEAQARLLAETVERICVVRRDLAAGKAPAIGDLTRLSHDPGEVDVGFDLPWPWGGERFELRGLPRLTYIIGPLGSGKTRLARKIAETMDGARFVGLDRLTDGVAAAELEADPGLAARIAEITVWLVDDGATADPVLTALLVALEAPCSALVVDMVEQGLDAPTQEAIAAYLRQRAATGPRLFLMTRSSSILDLSEIGRDEAIILCPANHAPPTRVAAYPGAPGYEAVASCLASPEVRARTEGMIAVRPAAA
ncbi:MerR family transcriptional regulator [Rhizobium sp. RU36D]|uniref:MerR family transcriptional regulator n=1 Tax=Rhizobium sp. RU36D TaxID=1907415 RepID=UPI0009D83BE6|nr:MerR family transcriptional regulator [Rhizobium sp. RU36D]SMD09690.1 transcriptional regulator, MerR family [Rhizobium sp. RU36D]